MFVSHRIPVQHAAVALACALSGAGVLGGVGALAAQPAAAAASRAARPAKAAMISSELERATGYSATQLTARPVCGAPRPGRIRCLAQELTVTRTGRAVALLHGPHTGAAAGSAQSATAAPQAFTASFLQWAYDTTWLSANRGAGDTVAIVDAYGDSSAYNDMEQFRSANRLPALPLCSASITISCFEVVNQSGQTSPLPGNANDETHSWNVEESLDIDAVSALCPVCKILVVEANTDDYNSVTNTYTADMETAVSTAARLGANQISLSWGGDTSPDASAYAAPYNSISSAAILAAAGDGSYPGPKVGYPAALPDVTAVGGTSLSSDVSAPRGFGESTWAQQTCAGGSTCGTESGCDTSQSIPTYQNGVTTDCAGRAYNDISADADPNTGLDIYDSQSGSEGCGGTNWCIVGGTSLATPLTAAFEAISGITAVTPAWTYSDAAFLNDIVSGSDGICPANAYLICNAAIGWDGPTGNGSISGEVTVGGPGIGASGTTGANATDVTFAGGVYPNGEPTSYYWLYWPSGQPSSTGTQTASATASGRTLRAVSSTVCTVLTPNTAYDYELVASNSTGSETGYQGSFITPGTESAPTVSSAAAITGSAVSGQTLTGQAAWNDESCNSAPSYQWQESSSSGGPWTTVGTAQTYTLTSVDVGKYLRLSASESNAAGSTPSTSAAIGPVTGAAATTAGTTSTSSPIPTGSPTPTTTGAASSTTETVRFYRCAHRCTLIDAHGATTYRPTKADYGHYVKVVTTVTHTVGNIQTASATTRWVGPITASTAGDISIGSGARIASAAVVRGSTRRALAQVRITRRRGRRLTLVITRRTRARTQTWAYVVSKGAVVSGTQIRSLNRPVTFTLSLKRGQTIKLVAVRT